MAQPIDERYLNITTYENHYAAKEKRTQEDREDNSQSVMISVHSVKTKLMMKKKKSKQRGEMKDAMKVCPGDPKTAVMIILAIGKPSDIWYPYSFRYQDPLNSWECCTFFSNSKTIKMAIEEKWVELRAKFQEENASIWQSVAQHIVLDECLMPISLKLAGEQSEKLKAHPTFLQFLSHDIDDNAIYHALTKSQKFLRHCKDWRDSEYPSISFDEIRKSFFGEYDLPTSYKFATSKFKHPILDRPDQLGASPHHEQGGLVLLHHNEAHIKFSQTAHAREICDREIKKQMEAISRKVDINLNLNELGAAGGL